MLLRQQEGIDNNKNKISKTHRILKGDKKKNKMENRKRGWLSF